MDNHTEGFLRDVNAIRAVEKAAWHREIREPLPDPVGCGTMVVLVFAAIIVGTLCLLGVGWAVHAAMNVDVASGRAKW